jgi:hypothetical protein
MGRGAAEVSSALTVALAYHEAWTSRDFERAMTYIDGQIVRSRFVFDREPLLAAAR